MSDDKFPFRRFHLVREVDISGISGTGIVAEGVQFSDGTCVMRWVTKTHSTSIYNSIGELVEIHGHEGNSYVRFVENGKAT